MSKYCEFSSEILKVSLDGGETWEPAQPLTYRKKNMVAPYSKECGYSEASLYSGHNLTFTALQNNVEITFKSSYLSSMKYSLNSGSTWIDADRISGSGYQYKLPTLSNGEVIMVKGSGANYQRDSSVGTFSSTGLYEVRGNPYLNFCNTTLHPWDMFENDTHILSAENLYLAVNNNAHFAHMFAGCTSLIKAPTILYDEIGTGNWAGCEGMFSGCTSLQTSPILMPKVVPYSGYKDMFYGCSSLNEIYCFAEDTTAAYCTDNWVIGVNNNGIFHKNYLNNNWPTGSSGIPTNWIIGNMPLDYNET